MEKFHPFNHNINQPSTHNIIKSYSSLQLSNLSRKENPTFKSDFVKLSFIAKNEHQSIKPIHNFKQQFNVHNPKKRQSMNQKIEELDFEAQRIWGNRYQPQKNNNPQNSHFNNFRILQNSEQKVRKSTNKLSQQPVYLSHELKRQNKSSKSASLVKLFLDNDQGIFIKQSKPYNIISNVPKQQYEKLRNNQNFSSEYKHLYQLQNNNKSGVNSKLLAMINDKIRRHNNSQKKKL